MVQIQRRTKISRPRFNLELQKGKGRCLIYLIYRYKKDKDGSHIRLKYSIREMIEPKYWNAVSQRMNVTALHPEYSNINEKLVEIERESLRIARSNPDISVEEFKNQLDYFLEYKIKPYNGPPTFFAFIDAYIEKEKAKITSKASTWKKYKTVYNHLKKFCISTNRGDLGYADIDMSFFHSFTDWLYQKPRRHSINTASKIIQEIKKFVRMAYNKFYEDSDGLKQRYHQNQIFLDPAFTVSRINTTKVVLSFEELELLEQLDLKGNDRLDRVRDLFLIGAYSGLRISDFIRLKPENIVRGKEHDFINIYTYKGRDNKKDNAVSIPIMPQLERILKKHNYISPKPISAQKMNDYLKELCRLAGLTETFERKYSQGGETKVDYPTKCEHITNHCARYSFITNMLSLNVTAETLSKITGQSIKVLHGYEQIDKQKNAIKVAESLPQIFSRHSNLKIVK